MCFRFYVIKGDLLFRKPATYQKPTLMSTLGETKIFKN